MTLPRIIVPAIVASLSLCASGFLGAARADWEPTRWGMSMDEAMRVLPATATMPADSSFDSRTPGNDKDQPGRSYLYVQVERQNRHYDVRLGFVEDRLKSVELTMRDATEARCEDVRKDLQRRYGTPLNGGAGAGGRYDSWRSDKDAVVLVYRSDPGPRCLILLSPGEPPKSEAAPDNAVVAWLR